REYYAVNPAATGRPQAVAVEVQKNPHPSHAQRANLLIYPAADQDYTLEGRYYIQPEALSTVRPIPYGSSEHSGTLKAACLASAELELDNEFGVRNAYFLKRLSASIAIDQRAKEQYLGYNGDASDMRGQGIRPVHGGQYVTFNGVLYDS